MYDIIIIGAGTAGLTAGIYAARAEKKVLILDGISYGGQIITAPEVANYPSIKSISGYDFATNLYEQTLALGAEIEIDKVLKIENYADKKVVVGENAKYEGKAVIIATGAKARTLNLLNETALLGRGISYCAICDGAFYKNKTVAVSGGGNTAFDDALFLSAYCKKVYLIHRRKEFRAENKIIEQLKAKNNVEFVLDTVIKELVFGEVLTAVKLENTVTKQESNLEINGLFVSIGRSPDTEFVKGQITLDESGYVKAGEDCKTNIDGIFVAGDCRVKTVRQLTTAVADGAVSALNAINYLD